MCSTTFIEQLRLCAVNVAQEELLVAASTKMNEQSKHGTGGQKMANEKRLIEVKTAWKKAQRIYSDPVILHCIQNVLDVTPTVDAVEVVHGRWLVERKLGVGMMVVKCSNCDWQDADTYDAVIPYESYAYCPNCGAKMDGGDKNG